MVDGGGQLGVEPGATPTVGQSDRPFKHVFDRVWTRIVDRC
jgi:hypothetical protein